MFKYAWLLRHSEDIAMAAFVIVGGCLFVAILYACYLYSSFTKGYWAAFAFAALFVTSWLFVFLDEEKLSPRVRDARMQRDIILSWWRIK